MSIILDALRRGRGPSTPPPVNRSAAQTDAVLQTLGYGRFSPRSPLNRVKRVLGYLAAGIAIAAVLWGASSWIGQGRLAPGTSSVDDPPMTAPHRSVPDGPSPPASGAFSTPGLSIPAGMTSATVVPEDDNFRRAVIYQRQGDFENALFHYKQLLKRDDLNAEAHNNLGVLYRDKGLLEDAVTEFRSAIAIDPRDARARNNLGVVYLRQRKLDAAASEFHEALAIDPAHVESLVNLSTVNREAGRREEAHGALVRALELDARNAEAHYNLALLEDEAGNREQALTHYRAFLQRGAAGYPQLVADVRKRVDALTR